MHLLSFFSIKAKDCKSKGGDEVTQEHWEHHDAEDAAHHDAKDSIDLGQELWSNQLSKHLEWIQCEGDSSNWGWKIWRVVWLGTARSNLQILSLSLGEDSQVESNLDSLSVLVGGEHEGVVVLELNHEILGHLLLKERIIVVLVQSGWLLCHPDILE